MSRELPSQIGPYRVLRKLGEGGMGVVYEAINDEIERRVAIKCLNAEYAADEEATRRFFNEARAANRIQHPSIVQISDYSTGGGNPPYIVMEFLEGQTLAALIHHYSSQLKGALPLSQALTISWQISTALTAAHEKNIVHRDLKPENVMLVPDPVAPGKRRVKVLDFGVAKLASTSASKTGASVIMGTPRYMSPEQCRGAGHVDDRADCYSLGVMLFEMLSGRLPFLGDGAGELIAQHMLKEPPDLLAHAKDTPAPLAALINRLLKKEPIDRPRMSEVAGLLDQLIVDCGALGERASRAMAVIQVPIDADAAEKQGGGPSGLPGDGPGTGRSAALIGAIGVMGVVLLVGVATVVRALSQGQGVHPVITVANIARPDPQLGEAAKPSPSPSPERTVSWVLKSTPAGADVVAADGQVLGKTPLVLSRTAQQGTFPVTLRLAGYGDRELTLDQSQDAQRSELLTLQGKRSMRLKKDKQKPDSFDSAAPQRTTSYED